MSGFRRRGEGMSLKRKAKILLGHLVPRNKIVRFIVLEVIALLISLFLFLSTVFVSFYIAAHYYEKQNPPTIGEADLGIIFPMVIAFYISFPLSIIFAVVVHICTFKKFFMRRNKENE
jgi:ABC-type phosphate transport system permease subunit